MAVGWLSKRWMKMRKKITHKKLLMRSKEKKFASQQG
jgi:hypothetical protein